MNLKNNYTILPKEVHIWKTLLDINDSDQIEAFLDTLNDDEVRRAERFCFADDRLKFIISRGTLRFLLGRYLNESPKNFVFQYNKYGKPYLNNLPLHFNVSHSKSVALYAFSLNEEIGIDVEYCKSTRNINLVSRSFSELEQKAYNELPDSLKMEAFYKCWTRKEAFMKAVGDGFSIPLKSFDVSLDHNPRLIEIRDLDHKVHEWTLHDIPVPDNYKATLAIKDKEIKTLFFEY